jgi:Fatty acid synthesis protein
VSEPVTIAVDGMGGDIAPQEPVRGSLAAAVEGIRILLVGRTPALEAELQRQGGRHPNITIVDAPDLVSSGEDGAKAVRAKPESSLVVATKLVADGRAQAVMSPGNTGATLAAATLHLRRIPGVLRPGIAVIMPSGGGPVVLIDAGANAETKVEYLEQFAVMGRLLARDVLRIREPRVGLLSIGEEEGKGTELVRTAYDALEGTEGFIGNVEGRDIPTGATESRATARSSSMRAPGPSSSVQSAMPSVRRPELASAVFSHARRSASSTTSSTPTPTAAPTCSGFAGSSSSATGTPRATPSPTRSVWGPAGWTRDLSDTWRSGSRPATDPRPPPLIASPERHSSNGERRSRWTDKKCLERSATSSSSSSASARTR